MKIKGIKEHVTNKIIKFIISKIEYNLKIFVLLLQNH